MKNVGYPQQEQTEGAYKPSQGGHLNTEGGRSWLRQGCCQAMIQNVYGLTRDTAAQVADFERD